MDVALGNEVKFGRVNQSTGNIEMTPYSEQSENMVVVANPMELHNTPLESELPDVSRNDVVKFWIAPKNGTIQINDFLQIDNTLGAEAIYSIEVLNPQTGKNGRIFLKKLVAGMTPQAIVINHYNDYYNYIQSMTPSTTDHLGINSGLNLTVQSGDKVFFRLHKREEDNFAVYSDPEVKYVDVSATCLLYTSPSPRD